MFGFGTDEYSRYGTRRDGERYQIEPYPWPERPGVWDLRIQYRIHIILWWLCLGFLTNTRVHETGRD